MPDRDALIDEQVAYYRARAAEYDRMLEREGRYQLDSLDPSSEDADTRGLGIIEEALAGLGVQGDVLELACGPGWWTKRLAMSAASVTGLDASPEMLALNRSRVGRENVRLLESDIFDWSPDRLYDLVFFSFWLSHVPPDRFDEFWTVVANCLKPGGRVFFADERQSDPRDGPEESLHDDRGTAVRGLEDGRRFRMVKVYYPGDEIERRLTHLGWDARVEGVGSRLYYGIARRT